MLWGCKISQVLLGIERENPAPEMVMAPFKVPIPPQAFARSKVVMLGWDWFGRLGHKLLYNLKIGFKFKNKSKNIYVSAVGTVIANGLRGDLSPP